MTSTAVSFHNQAAALAESDPQMAFKLLVSAVEADPAQADSWRSLADTAMNANLRDAAVGYYRRYLELRPQDGRAWVSLGHCLYHRGKIDEADAATRYALALDDSLANGWTNLSLIDSIKGKIKESLAHAKEGFRLDPNPTTELALGFALMHARRLDVGLRHFEAKLPNKMPQFVNLPWPVWRGEDLTGKTLFVLADQGMGDTLDFLRFVPQAAVRCNRIIFHIQQEMMRLASLMLVDFSNIDLVPLGQPWPQADMWIAVTSLPVALGLSSDEIEHAPQLTMPKFADAKAPWLAPGKFNVGICWAGNPGNDIDRWRSMKLEQFLEFAAVPGVQLYGLQFDQRRDDIHNLGAAGVVRDMSRWVRDSLDVSSIIRQMDLVICIESYIGHLCAALGKEVWIAYGWCGGDWRIGRKGQRLVWHPTARIFYQERTHSWDLVIREIREALAKRVTTIKRAAV
ncbi:MAG: hypothetical protein KGL39_07735 [Patescibacteria group bacterium]|nr:hypothetical protein [Patescibacteria group bacterium]